MKVDKVSMLVTDFEDIDRDQLMNDLIKWIYKCEKTSFLISVMESFRIQCELDPNQFFQLQSTVFPIRMLHSLIKSGYIDNVELPPKYLP